MYNIRESGRAIRTLQLPSRSHTLNLGAFSTDRRAYDYREYCPEKDHTTRADRPWPLEMDWSIVSLHGATQDIHISPDGAGTVVECLVGSEWYILLRPKGCLDHRQFGNTERLLLRLDELIHNHYDVEAFLLRPGMRLFIRPCTPYCVYTVENSITHGSHFYSLSTMQDTFFGLVHNLARGSSITESPSQPFRHILRTIVQYLYNALVHNMDSQIPFFRHAMDPNSTEITLDNVRDLLSVISIGILSNALDRDTYKLCFQASDKHLSKNLAQMRWNEYDYNALPHDDRVGCTYARGFAYELRDWFCHFFAIHGRAETTMVTTQKIIAHQAFVLFKAQMASDKYEASDVNRQISSIFKKDSAEFRLLANQMEQEANRSPHMCYSLSGCTVSTIDDPPEFQPRSIEEIHALGMSPLDDDYKRGRECAFEVHIEGRNKKRRQKE